MTPRRAGAPPGGSERGAEVEIAARQPDDHHKDTAPMCRPGCALACAATPWSWVLDDTREAPARWRVAWCLLGVPKPLPPDCWRDMLAAVEDTYGPREIVAGLRLAVRDAGMYADADRARLRALLTAYVREVAA